MDRPTSKKIGVPRFDGKGKLQPRPGSVKWYKQHMPERFNNTKITIRDTGGFTEEESERIAASVLRWNEGPQPHINDSIMKASDRLNDSARPGLVPEPDAYFSFTKRDVERLNKE